MLRFAAAGAAVSGGLAAGIRPSLAAPSPRTAGLLARNQEIETLTIGQPAPFQFLDPQRTYLSSESSMHQSIFDTLVAFDNEA
ncbi:MAG: hypothetical protein KC438_02835 [Thermomicrobiales bacterium]|nr:hypothetical protein [Thermomicrobiales bacterium]MCO5221560.1 hypothetical protein [Thermomicrobiales bacterium]